MQSPSVSVILTSHNGAATVARAIESVRSQTFADWELVVYDDGSTDGTVQIVAQVASHDPRVKLTEGGRQVGRQAALNAACASARGTYLAIIDDDDQWTDRSKLALQVSFLNAHPRVGVVGTWANVVTPDGKVVVTLRPATDDGTIRAKILSVNQIVNSSAVFRKDIFDKIGCYERTVQLPANEDHDLWLRLGHVAKFANLPTVTVAWQKSPRSYSAGKRRAMSAAQFSLIKKYGSAYLATAVRYAISFIHQKP